MEKISVLVRARPLDKQEASKGVPWKFTGNTIFLYPQGPKFDFDRVFGEESKTVDIYEARTKDIVAAAVRGFNGTVFAYGQTSSGKTHTMRGSFSEPGVIPLAVRDVFRNIEEAEDREFLLRMSYMEIYNEEINDLLVPEHRKLQVHESLERGIFVAGLREEIVATPKQVLQFMEFGESHRHVGETNMNIYSSRSHTIFRMVIESRDKNEDDSSDMSCDAVRVSVLNLVDLAGSERVAKTGAEGARLKEGSHINKSLMTLGTVINKLSEGVESQGGHVPYRDSKLTRILQPALGGNAKTAIICNITPALVHVDETKGTLQFASRALRVTNCAQVNEVLTDAALLKRQKREIEELRAKLQGSHSGHLAEEILNLRNTLLQSELERERIALELQEEKKAQAERERQLKEQAQKIENLSTMVLYSTMDDREKRVKKNTRRETWCPTVPLKEFSEEDFIHPSKGTLCEIIPGRRERDLPPPFQTLCEEQESNSQNSKDSQSDSRQTILKENIGVPSLLLECPLPDAIASVNVTDRKKKSSVEGMTLNEVKDELLELQTRYQDLECEYENQRKIKNSEIEDLRKRLAKAEAAANKQQKVNKLHLGQSTDRRGKSLTGWESEAFMLNKQLEDQVKTLELEKIYMQRDLDRMIELAKEEKEDARRTFEELQEELREAQEEAARKKQQLDSALAETNFLKKEKEEGLGKIISEFDELRIVVESLKPLSNEIEMVGSDSIQVFYTFQKSLQEISCNVIEIRDEIYNMGMNTKVSEYTSDFKRGNESVSDIAEISSQRCGEGIADDQFSSGPSLYEFNEVSREDSLTMVEEAAGGETLKSPFIEDNSSIKKLSLSGPLDKGTKPESTEIVRSVMRPPNTDDEPNSIDILAFLEMKKQNATKMLEDLRALSHFEELFSEKLLETSGLDEMLSDLQHSISESNRLLTDICMQSHSKSWSDIEVTEVHLSDSHGLPDCCPAYANRIALSPSVGSTFFNGQSKNHGNTEMAKQDIDKGDCNTSGNSEQVHQFEFDAEGIPSIDVMMTEKALNSCDLKARASSSIHSRLETFHKQCETREACLETVDQSMDYSRGNDAKLIGVVNLDGMNAEIKSLKGKLKCLEAELETTIQERSRFAEAETVAHKQIESVEAALKCANEEKEHFQEVHKETLIKLQTSDKEIESLKNDLDALCKCLQQCNFEKKVAVEKMCQLEDILCKKIEELNAFVAEHRNTCVSLMKTADELEKEVQISLSQKVEEHKILIGNHEIACTALRKKIEETEQEKAAMTDQIADGLQNLEKLKLDLESTRAMHEEQVKEYITENTQLMSEVSSLRKEVTKSSSSTVLKERESLRKELEKSKLKLKDTEAKFRNMLQEKSRLEAEKANTEREIKLLRGQSSLLQRDISKRESLADKRRESKAFDLTKAKSHIGYVEQSLQLKTVELERAQFDLEILRESYNSVERTLVEAQDKLTASEGELFVANEERETLASELEVLSEQLNVKSSELNQLHEKHSALNEQLNKSEKICRQLEDSLNSALREKEEISMQLTYAFLQLEEEKAVSCSREKASIEALKEEERRKLSVANAEVSALKEDLEKMEVELESSKEQCKQLFEQLSLVEVSFKEQIKASSLQSDKLREELHRSEAERETSENAMKNIIEDLKSSTQLLSSENEKVYREVAALRTDIERVKCERDDFEDKYNEIQFKLTSTTDTMQSLMEGRDILEEELANEKLNFIKETTKLDVRLKSTRAKLDAFRGRYVEVLDELAVMHCKFTEDSRKLQEQLVASRLETMELKKKHMAMG